MTGEVLLGRLVTGIGQGRLFTQLDWARRQFIDKLGIDPYPGTVNIVIDDPDAITQWVRLKRTPGVVIENPGNGPHDCDGRCYRVKIAERIDGAIVVPEVPDYPPAQVEVVAAVGVREALALEDGDPITPRSRQAATLGAWIRNSPTARLSSGGSRSPGRPAGRV